jgi:Tfp pilus assembly protein PilZ
MAVEVAAWGENTFFSGFDGTLASGGLFVATLETLPVGHTLDLTLQLEGRTMRCRGRVAFQRIDSLVNPQCSPGAGLFLAGLGAEDMRAVEAFLQKRAPMFWVAPPAR